MRSTRWTVSVAFVLAAVCALAGCDWAQVGFGPANTGLDPAEPALTAASVAHLHRAWSTTCVCQKPIVAGGTVYVLDRTDGRPPPYSLRAFDAATGAPRWSTVVGTTPMTAHLDAVANGLLYVRVQPRDSFRGDFSESGRLVAFDAKTGASRWSVTPPASASGIAPIGPNVVVDGRTAFVASDGGASAELSAIDTDGRVLWSVTPGGTGGALAADPGRTIYMMTGVLVTTSRGFAEVPVLAGYDEGLGEPRSAVLPALGPVGVARIAYAGGLIYGFQDPLQASGGVGLFAVHPDGRLAWSTASSTLGAVGPITVGSVPGGQGLGARNTATGALLWSSSTSAPTVDPVLAGGLVYYGTGPNVLIAATGGVPGGNFVAFSPEDVAFVTPSEGRVFVTTANHLVAVTP